MRIVHTLDELALLASDRQVNGFWARTEVRLEIPAITEPALLSAQEELNQLQDRRGTVACTGLMFLTLMGGVITVMNRHESLLSWRAAAELLLVLGFAFTLGYVARFVSRAWTRWQFAHRCREQHRRLMGLAGTAGS